MIDNYDESNRYRKWWYSAIVNNIIKEYNLKENFYYPLLNIIEQSINVLINFDKINPSKIGIKNLEENKNLIDDR